MTRAGERNLDALRRLLGSKAFWSALVALLLAANFARFHQPDQALRTDSRYFVHFAILVADGAVPHRDFFDNKTALASLAGGLLVRAGRLVELNPIDSIRMASLGIVALAGLLGFWAFRRLAGGSTLRAFVALMPYLGLSYIGSLPSSGNVPKLIMATCATGAALAAARGRWFTAGVVAAIAPLDWQLGIFACFGVATAALWSSEPSRAFRRTCGGGAAVAAVFLLYFIANGALDVMLAQTVGASFARGAARPGPLLELAEYLQSGLLTPVRLDALPGLARNQTRSHHLALDAQTLELALQRVAARAGLIGAHEASPLRRFQRRAQRPTIARS